MVGFALAFVKYTIVIVAVLVLGNLITLKGKTISEHVRENLIDKDPKVVLDRTQDWAKGLSGQANWKETKEKGSKKSDAPQDQILAQEKKKLQNLLQSFSN